MRRHPSIQHRTIDLDPIESTRNPLRPCSMISGTEPCAQAITGVPQASDSIITNPNGSGQSIGNNSAAACASNCCFCASSASPRNSTPGAFSNGRMDCATYAASASSILAAIFSGMPTRCAISTARSSRFSGEIRPTKAR